MTALFLKYRPQTFSDLVGQEVVKNTLKNALNAERPAHAYLFAGSRGTGKTSMARIFAKGLNCTNLQNGDPCGKCKFCIDTANGSLIDVIEIDAASNRGIDEIRDLREKITFLPNVAKRKVYIIDEVHMLTKEAFNALLKTLEEPPDHAYFCLATTEIHKIPETITSRCQTFLFERFPLESLVGRLDHIAKGESIKAEKKALQLIAQKAEGGMRDAISLLEQISAETQNNITEENVQTSLGLSSTELLIRFYDTLLSGQTEDGLNLLKTVSKIGGDFRTFGHDFLAFLRTKMFENVQNPTNLSRILQIIEEIEKALFRLKTSPIIELPLEIAVINLTTNSNGGHVTAATETKSTPLTQSKVKPTPQKQPEPKVAKKKSELATGDGYLEAPKSEKVITKTKNNSAHSPAGLIGVQQGEKEVENKSSKSKISQSISAQAITQKMEVIIKKSGIPVFAKKSFMTTIPEVDGQKVIFYTDSEFHREKLSSTEILLKIKHAMNDIFGNITHIEFLKKGGLDKPKIAIKKEDTATVDDFLSF